MTNLIEKIRNLNADILKTNGRQTYQYLSTAYSKIITLSKANAVASSLLVYKNGVLWANSNYSYNSDTVQVTITGTLAVGDVLLLTFSYYEKYSDSEIRGWIKAAISYLSVEKYNTFAVKSDNIIIPTPDESQENLIAIIAGILMGGDIRQYRTPDFTIVYQDNEPKEKRIARTVAQFKKSYGSFKYVDMDVKTAPDTLDDVIQ